MNLTYWLPFFVVVFSNTCYHIVAKSTPAGAPPFLSLCVTYLVSFVISAVIYAATGHSFHQDWSQLNWTSYAWGFVLVALEAGYVFLYRVGWKISVASLFLNVSVALALIVIGLVVYKDHLSLREMAGGAFCLLGIVFLHG